MTIKTNKMKPLMLLCVGMFFVSVLLAQQKPQYTQYVLNEYIINPALTGIENYVDVKIAHRHQWIGINDAPVTSYITIHGPIGDKKDNSTNVLTIFSVPGENPRGKEYWQNYKASPTHMGIGLQIINDDTGPFNNFSIMGTYALHMRISKKANLSAGIGIGASDYSLNTSKLFFGIDYPVDPAVYGSGVLGKTQMDMNAGLWLYSNRYFAGFAAMQLLPQKLDFSGNLISLSKGVMVPHFFTTFGYRFLINDDVNALPSIMVKDVDPLPMQYDFNIKLTYRDQSWIGLTYRGLYGFAAMAGVNVNNHFTISYDYDYSTTKINTVSAGTHEIIIGFLLSNKYSDTNCPRNIW